MENCSNQNNPTHTVLIGAGRSVADFLLNLETNPLVEKVTIIGQDWTDLFFLQCLCGLMNLEPVINQIEPGECVGPKGLFFIFSKVEKIDFDKKEIFCPNGRIQYNSLVLVNENRPKALLNHKLKRINKQHSNSEFSSWIKNVNNITVVEGNDFPALAMAERLSSLGIKTYLVCKNNNLSDEFLPGEEACLLAKHLKNNGIRIFFDQQIEKYLLDQSGNITGFRLTNGEEFACTMVVHASGNFPEFSYLRETAFYSGESFIVDQFRRIPSLKDVFVMGENLSVEKCTQESSIRREHEPCQHPGLEKFFQYHWQPKKSIQHSIHYEVMGMTWTVYGDFSTNWGNHTQNFYWEHPNGQISLRLLYDINDFSIKTIAMLGIGFKDQFLENVTHGQWKVDELIAKMDMGMEYSPESSEIPALISKAFSVEFKELIKENNPSFIDKILERLF